MGGGGGISVTAVAVRLRPFEPVAEAGVLEVVDDGMMSLVFFVFLLDRRSSILIQ